MASEKTVDDYLEKHANYREALSVLRDTILSSGLEETVKWGAPTYTLDGKNVVGIAAFKQYFGLWFFQGALLSDPGKVLVNAQQGKTRGMRQWRFRETAEIDVEQLRAYLREAIANEQAGKSIKPRKEAKVAMPAELTAALEADKALSENFESLTPGRQREYAEFIGSAKQEATRLRRLEKARPIIQAGRGLNDKYR